ncbi:MAG TPA: extracellular solute-binding protein [Aggregatilineaceae bacterium]|nr:extracellular solute-binding protein [Aggregatilineaceae bacterium]
MQKHRLFALVVVLALVISAFGTLHVKAQDEAVELHIMWYNDGTEGDVLRDLLDRFEAENPNIKTVIDVVAYKDLDTVLQAQLEGGTPPDMVRLTNVGRFKDYYLDMTPNLPDVDYWLENFPEPVLNSLRKDADDTGIYGYPTQFTITGPFINRSLFEEAGVAVPIDEKEDVSWEEWLAAAEEVAQKTGTPYAVAIDRSGHRFWGPSLSMCATYVNEDGTFTVDSQGFRDTANMILDWHTREITPVAVWAGSGDTYAAANEYFINGELVFYMSGSWQIGGFAEKIGDSFKWEAVPNPSGPCGSTGIPGGAVMVALNTTQHPAEVAMVMDYLASYDVLGEFSARTLFIPGHTGLAADGVAYEQNKEALDVFLAEIPKLMPEAYALQYHPYTFVLNTSIRDRLTQAIVGELTLDEAILKIQEDVDAAMAE